jgi:hypothetical protein
VGGTSQQQTLEARMEHVARQLGGKPQACVHERGVAMLHVTRCTDAPFAGWAGPAAIWIGDKGDGVIAVPHKGQLLLERDLPAILGFIQPRVTAFDAYLLMAYTLSTGAMPTKQLIQRISMFVTAFLDPADLPQPGTTGMADEATLRELVRLALAGGPWEVGTTSIIPPLSTRWDAARWLCLLSTEMWALRGEAAHRILSVPLVAGPAFAQAQRNRLVATAVAGLLWTPQIHKLLPFRDVNALGGVYMRRWADLAAGPRDLPAVVRATLEASEGLSQWADITQVSPAQEAELDAAKEKLANQDARSLSDEDQQFAANLLGLQGAPPRYVGQTHQLHLDDLPELMDMLTAAGMASPLVSVHQDGLWLTWRWIARQTSPDSTKAIWWSPRLPHAASTPLGLAGIWCRIHLLLASIWHDLCAPETVVALIEHPVGEGRAVSYQTRLKFEARSQLRQHAERIVAAGQVIASASPFW